VTAPIAGDAGQRQTSGVLLHAYGADQIVRLALGQSSQTVAPSASVARLLVLAPAVAVGLAAVMGTTLLALAGAAVLVTIAVAVLGYGAFTADLWLPVVPMALSAVAAALVIIAYRSILERHRRLALASLLTSQVSPAIARQVWENRHLILDGKTPKPVRLTATVLFVDLAGSTTIADTAEPAVLVEWISRFLTEMAECVACHDGVIEKFTGDGLMAVFGVPVPRQTGQDIAADARNAAACALQMADRVEALNATAGEMGFPPTRCRIGIHSGPLSAGNVGTIDRMQYSVIGQTANLAARIEGYGKDDRALTTDDDGRPLDCRILLSGATADLLGDDIALRPIGPVQLRGAQTPIPLHRLLPTRADAGTANDPGEPDAKGS